MQLFALVLLVSLSRLLPHPPNFACVGALALFAGYNLRSTAGGVLPLLALFVSDLLGHFLRVPGMGFYQPLTMVFVYGSFATIILLGRFLASRAPRNGWILAGSLCGATLLGSVLFFLVSNFGVFLQGDYGFTFAGLTRCYVAALPFFGNTLAGDAFFGVLLFGSAALTGKLYATHRTQPESSGRAAISE